MYNCSCARGRLGWEEPLANRPQIPTFLCEKKNFGSLQKQIFLNLLYTYNQQEMVAL